MLNKSGWAEDVALATLFLASHSSFWVTGVTLDVAGLGHGLTKTWVVVCRQTAEGVYEDENDRYELNEQFRATLVFVRQRGRWRLAGLQLSPILGRP